MYNLENYKYFSFYHHGTQFSMNDDGSIDSVELPSTTLLPPQTSDRIVPASAAQLQGAYMWSLELLIAAALCATRDALYPPSPTVQMPSPPTHHGMEILGELAELEIQNRNRDSKEKGLEGKGLRG